MIDLPAELLPQSDEDKFLRQEWKARWEGLKPVIVKLYTGNYGKSGKPATINEIADAMRRHYSFHAAYVPTSKAMPSIALHLTCFNKTLIKPGIVHLSIPIGFADGVSVIGG